MLQGGAHQSKAMKTLKALSNQKSVTIVELRQSAPSGEEHRNECSGGIATQPLSFALVEPSAP